MKAINLITPPDIIRHRSYKIFLVYPDNNIKTLLQEQIGDWNHQIDIYVYEEEAIDWAFNVFAMCDLCIINLDASDSQIRDAASYFISDPKTYWLTQGENLVYNKLSLNRVYNLDFIETLIGGFSATE